MSSKLLKLGGIITPRSNCTEEYGSSLEAGMMCSGSQPMKKHSGEEFLLDKNSVKIFVRIKPTCELFDSFSEESSLHTLLNLIIQILVTVVVLCSLNIMTSGSS